jgi:hypothetical protein
MNKQESIDFLRKIFQPKDVFEIRVLGASTSNFLRPHVESGYFDYEHIEAAVNAISSLRFYKGVYVTVNPVNRDLHARAYNRIRPVTNEPTTSDSDVEIQRWLLIDCDPIRVSGVSSSEMEHENAISLACDIRDRLMSLGWSEPIMLDSGNGAQLMWNINLPASENELVKQAIHGIANASNDNVSVDLSVYNPARIWRLPGTMNCKGDNIPDRPHREAKVLAFPERTEPVPKTLLEMAASWANVPSMKLIPTRESETGNFDIDSWINQYCPTVGKPQVWKNGRKWVFPVCPFNSNHTNHSAVLLEQPNGAIAFRCHHNSCSGNSWHKLREMLEPGCYDKKEENLPTVDCSTLLKNMNSKPQAETTKKDSFDEELAKIKKVTSIELPAFPKELLEINGFIKDFMNFCLATAPSPQPELALAAGIVLQGHLAARKVDFMAGVRTNPYVVMLAPSGSGKNHPRRLVRKVVDRVGLSEEVFDECSSGQGLEDKLIARPALLWQADEIYEMLQGIVKDTSGNKEKMLKMLMTLHTTAADSYTTRVKAGVPGTVISCPNLSLLGACTPEGFFNSINDRVIGHGLYGRMTLIPAFDIPKLCMPKSINIIPASLHNHAYNWANFVPPGSGNMNPKAMDVKATEEASEYLSNIQQDAYQWKVQLSKEKEPDWKVSLASRAFESICRYALIYACSETSDPAQTIVTKGAVEWAKKLVFWDIENKFAMVAKYHYESEFERISERVIEILRRWHEKQGYDVPMPAWVMNRKTKSISQKDFDEVIQRLKGQERIIVTHEQTGGRPKLVYMLATT